MSLIAKCHCGATQIELPDRPTKGTSCNCSFCVRTGAIWAYYKPGELKFLSREDEADYAPNTSHHYFCSKCGIHTWGDSLDWGSLYNADGSPKGQPDAMPTEHQHQVNLNLVDDLDWSTVEIEKMDGKNSW